VVDFVEICNVCARKAIIEAAKRISNSDKVCHSYSDLNFGVTFFGTQCIFWLCLQLSVSGVIVLKLLVVNLQLFMFVCKCRSYLLVGATVYTGFICGSQCWCIL